MFFFFFTNRYDSYVQDNSDSIVDRLQRITEAQGIRNVDLAEMTGWSTSKVSKILQHNQKLSLDDFRTWCMVLGYTPKVFINNEDLRQYDINEHTAPLTECITDLVKVTKEDQAGDVFDVQGFDFRDESDSGEKDNAEDILDIISRFEFPLSIISHLNVEPSDYFFHGKVREQAVDAFEDERVVTYEVRVRARNVSPDGDYMPEIRCIIDPVSKIMVWGVFFYNKANGPLSEQKRKHYKDVILTEEKDTKEFQELVDAEIMELSASDKKGEIFSFIYTIDKLPSEAHLVQDLQTIYAKYGNLVYEVCGVDIQGIRGKTSTLDMFNALTGASLFSAEIEESVKKTREYKCEIDSNHESFSTDEGHPYMEVVPLVPLVYSSIGAGIKSEANAVCLCPMRAAKFKHGKKNEREDMVIQLWRKHAKALSHIVDNVSLSSVLQLNGL